MKTHPLPFPWKCSKCGEVAVEQTSITHSAKVKHHGRLHTVSVKDLPVLQCKSCREIVFDNSSHDAVMRALRHQLGLLHPEEIKQERLRLGLSQEELAKRIDAALSTVCRWEKGQIVQSRRSDRALRGVFSASRDAIQERSSDLERHDELEALGARIAREVMESFPCGAPRDQAATILVDQERLIVKQIASAIRHTLLSREEAVAERQALHIGTAEFGQRKIDARNS